MNKFALRPLVAALVLSAPVMSAFATDGYFSHGYGMKAKGMGGAAVASTDNAFAGANNPATSAWAGNRMEAGVDWFSPIRSASRSSAMARGSLDSEMNSGSESFLIPEFGYNKAYNNTFGYGITVYGNGGMNTDYAKGDPLFDQGQSRMGVDLTQLIIAPTLAMKLDEKHSVGVSPLFVVQQISVQGLQNFTMDPSMSTNSKALTNRGYDQSTGLGVRLGYLGKLTPELNVGVSYSPKTKMTKFGDYEGMFAGAGGFDIPENYAIGLSYQASNAWAIAMDYQRINYGDVPSIANVGTSQGQFGSATGAGFGWKSINVVKLGTEWKYSTSLTLRAGVNLSDNPIDSSQVTFNRLAPGVMTTHYTLGGTYSLSPTTEVTMAYMYAPQSSVSGASQFNGAPTGDPSNPNLPTDIKETIRMKQQSLGIQFGWKF
jgi:long-chain fatty acid transport protein